MTDRPIIFSAPMIRALLDGRNSMTRRIIKPSPEFCGGGRSRDPQNWNDPDAWGWENYDEGCWDLLSEGYMGRPFYAPGDRLWVREAWARVPVSAYRASEGVDQRQSPFDYEAAIYRAGFDRSQGGIHWRSPIHMPRWASRLTLLVTDVRVQRLQEISSADAIAEGCPPYANSATIDCDTPNPRDDFKRLWNSIHGPDAWDANPWVAAISFTVHRCNIDTMEEGTW